jgi:hypothetical protein
MSFTKGQTYAGAFIVEQLGAEPNSDPYYALHSGDTVLAFALNRWQNLNAPAEVWVGYGPLCEKYADSFIEHHPTVPVFIKEREADDLWHCAGYFTLARVSDENADKNQRVKWPNVPGIYKILFLQEVQP